MRRVRSGDVLESPLGPKPPPDSGPEEEFGKSKSWSSGDGFTDVGDVRPELQG